MIDTSKPVTGGWRLADLPKPGKNSPKVFSTFSCGGGSTMGWKLAGFDVVGYCEIDPRMADIYETNHNPRLSFRIPIQVFKSMVSAKADIGFIDILDGSPPCSSFSISGNREKDWGKKKVFKEGQAKQVLDDLFFHFLDAVEFLLPKIVVAENVPAMLSGNAKGYVKEIMWRFDRIGFDAQMFVLDASRMGVPQRRKRLFFVARRRELRWRPLTLSFSESEIAIGAAIKGRRPDGKKLSEAFAKWWRLTPPGRHFSYAHPKGSFFNSFKAHPHMPIPTLAASTVGHLAHWSECRRLSADEMVAAQTFPDDFDFLGIDPQYVMGMSVPPFMMQRLALEIRRQWLGGL